MPVSIWVIKYDSADFKRILAAVDVGADNEETAALNKKIIELAWPILYLCDDLIQVKIVLATALMAIARKVKILDYEELEPMYISATGVVLGATGITYYFVHKIAP